MQIEIKNGYGDIIYSGDEISPNGYGDIVYCENGDILRRAATKLNRPYKYKDKYLIAKETGRVFRAIDNS